MTPLREYRVIVPDTKNNHAWDSPHIDLPHLRDFMKYKLQYEDVIVTEVPQPKRVESRFTDCGRPKGSPYEGQE